LARADSELQSDGGEGSLSPMETRSSSVDDLILDLLAFVADGERPYDEVMEAWRTSCPRLPVWEEANARDLVTRVRVDGMARVRITPAGLALLRQRTRSFAR